MSSKLNRIVLTAALLITGAVASGCSAVDRLAAIGERPALTAIENPTTQPGYKPVQMPMPKPEAASYNANSLWRNGSRAFFKDQRAHQVGDILTVT
ncbi:MAG TPA: flagellar basal body L-ring protein FlgH, partial [Pseudolabrys sp.]